MTPTRLRQGFTLIEILVVLAIMAILFALLFPTHKRGRPHSLTKCLSNQRQLAIGAHLYSDDSRKGFPNLDALPGNDGPISFYLITNYLSRADIFMCPAVVYQRDKKYTGRAEHFIPELSPAFFRSNGNDYAYYDGVKITNPTTNAFIADRFAWTNRPTTNIVHANWTVVAAFADGHSEALRRDRIIGVEYEPPWSAAQEPLLRP